MQLQLPLGKVTSSSLGWRCRYRGGQRHQEEQTASTLPFRGEDVARCWVVLHWCVISFLGGYLLAAVRDLFRFSAFGLPAKPCRLLCFGRVRVLLHMFAKKISRHCRRIGGSIFLQEPGRLPRFFVATHTRSRFCPSVPWLHQFPSCATSTGVATMVASLVDWCLSHMLRAAVCIPVTKPPSAHIVVPADPEPQIADDTKMATLLNVERRSLQRWELANFVRQLSAGDSEDRAPKHYGNLSLLCATLSKARLHGDMYMQKVGTCQRVSEIRPRLKRHHIFKPCGESS